MIVLVVSMLTAAAAADAQPRRGSVELQVADVAALEGLTGESLRETLAERLQVVVQGPRDGVPARFLVVRVERRRATPALESRPFEARTGALMDAVTRGTGRFPPFWSTRLFTRAWPTGGQVLDTRIYPPGALSRYVRLAAAEAARNAAVDHGLFLVVVVADPRLRRTVPSTGILLPFETRRR